MSAESAKQFVKKMVEDKAFAERVENLGGKKDRAAFIQQEGFDFTQEELMEVASELNAVDVVGGKCCGNTCEMDRCNKDMCSKYYY